MELLSQLHLALLSCVGWESCRPGIRGNAPRGSSGNTRSECGEGDLRQSQSYDRGNLVVQIQSNAPHMYSAMDNTAKSSLLQFPYSQHTQ